MSINMKNVALLCMLLGLAAAGIQVANIDIGDTPEGLLLHSTKVIEIQSGELNGTTAIFAVYTDADLTTRAPTSHPLAKRACGSNDVSCFTSYQANSAVCSNLVYNLEVSSAPVPTSPRALCLTAGCCGKCCVSWADPVQGSPIKTDLASSGYKVLGACAGASGVSGLTRNTLIGNYCNTQCLSSRATGCE